MHISLWSTVVLSRRKRYSYTQTRKLNCCIVSYMKSRQVGMSVLTRGPRTHSTMTLANALNNLDSRLRGKDRLVQTKTLLRREDAIVDLRRE